MSQLLQSISEVTADNVSSSTDVENNKNKQNNIQSKAPAISYSKDFLLGLQFAPSSLVKPELPNLHFLSDRVSCFWSSFQPLTWQLLPQTKQLTHSISYFSSTDSLWSPIDENRVQLSYQPTTGAFVHQIRPTVTVHYHRLQWLLLISMLIIRNLIAVHSQLRWNQPKSNAHKEFVRIRSPLCRKSITLLITKVPDVKADVRVDALAVAYW